MALDEFFAIYQGFKNIFLNLEKRWYTNSFFACTLP